MTDTRETPDRKPGFEQVAEAIAKALRSPRNDDRPTCPRCGGSTAYSGSPCWPCLMQKGPSR